MSQEFLSIKDLSILTGLGVSTIHYAIHHKKDFPVPIRINKKYLFLRKDIETFLNRLKQEAIDKKMKDLLG